MKSSSPILFAGLTIYILTLFACKKDKPEVIPPVNLPAIEAKSATTYPDGGVTLQGAVNEIPPGITDFGFLLSTDSLFTTYREIYKATSAIALGTFKIDINTNIEKGKTYFYAPYSITGNNIFKIYKYKSFTSSGSKRVRVGSISPLRADIGDTITIQGKYFSQNLLYVKFGIQYATLFLHNDSTLKFAVPESIDQVTPLITLNYNGITDTVSDKFILNKPLINDFTATATFRDTIIINGDHFNRRAEQNEVYLGNTKVAVAKSTRKQIKIVVPDNMETVTNTVSVKAQLQTVIATNKFNVKIPEITSVTPSGYANAVNGNGVLRDIINIKGKYFHPVAYNMRVFFEGNETPVLNGSSTELNTNIPQGPYPRKKAQLTVKFLDRVITYSYDIVLKDAWIMIANSIPFSVLNASGTFVFNNTPYVLAPTSELDGFNKSLWKFNSTNYSWQEIKLPFPVGNCHITQAGNKAYLYIANSTDNFWEYDPAVNKWTKKADCPGPVRYSPTTFFIGDKVFIGFGIASGGVYVDNSLYNTFYQYNINTDSWTKIADYPDPGGARVNGTAIVLGNTAYIGGGATFTPAPQLYSYSTATNSWKKLHDFELPPYGCFAFVANNTVYLSSGLSNSFPYSTYRSVYKYNLAADSWSMLPETIGAAFLGPSGFYNGFTFVINGYVFIGGMSSSGGNPQLFVAKTSDL